MRPGAIVWIALAALLAFVAMGMVVGGGILFFTFGAMRAGIERERVDPAMVEEEARASARRQAAAREATLEAERARAEAARAAAEAERAAAERRRADDRGNPRAQEDDDPRDLDDF